MTEQFLTSEMEVIHLTKTIEKLQQELRSTKQELRSIIGDQIEMLQNNATRFHHPRNGCDCDMSDEVCDLCRLSERWDELSK